MRNKKYESLTLLYIAIFIMTILLIILIIFSMKKNIRTYKVINSSVVKDNLVEVLVTDKDLKSIYNNKYLYLNRKKQLIRIEDINKNILKRKNSNYHSVILKVKLSKNAKINDIKQIKIFNSKINMFNMIKVIWKGV